MKNFKALLVFTFVFCALINNADAQKIEEADLKLNVGKIENAQELIKTLDPITFDYNQGKYKNMSLPEGKQLGFLVASKSLSHPELLVKESKVVDAGKNSTKVVRRDEIDYNAVVALLVSVVKEQQLEIENLKTAIKNLD